MILRMLILAAIIIASFQINTRLDQIAAILIIQHGQSK